MAGSEGVEELVVQVVSVVEDNQGGVLHRRMEDDLSGVEGHGEALAGPLGVPDDASAPIALGRGGHNGALYRLVYGVVLVIGGHLLGDLLAIVFEDYEVLYEIEEAGLLEDALDQHVQLRPALGRDLRSIYRPPGHEPRKVRGEGAGPRLQAVGDHQNLVVGEEGGDVVLVGLELLEG